MSKDVKQIIIIWSLAIAMMFGAWIALSIYTSTPAHAADPSGEMPERIPFTNKPVTPGDPESYIGTYGQCPFYENAMEKGCFPPPDIQCNADWSRCEYVGIKNDTKPKSTPKTPSDTPKQTNSAYSGGGSSGSYAPIDANEPTEVKKPVKKANIANDDANKKADALVDKYIADQQAGDLKQLEKTADAAKFVATAFGILSAIGMTAIGIIVKLTFF